MSQKKQATSTSKEGALSAALKPYKDKQQQEVSKAKGEGLLSPLCQKLRLEAR
jgi:hypothetical protein